MMERLDWFPCNPSKLLGALAAMKPNEGYVYVVVLLRIYEVGGPCRDSLDAIAVRTKLNKRIVSDELDKLFRAGKLRREGDGIINPYAASVLETQQARRGRAKASGQEGARQRWGKTKRNQKKGDGDPKPTPLRSDTELELELELEKGSKTDPAPKRGGVDDWPADYGQQFWERYPPQRRTDRKKVVEKLAAIRRTGEVTWATLTAGLARYVASSDVARGFARGPMVWLNGGCWDDSRVPANNGGGHAEANPGADISKLGFGGLRAALRAGRDHGGQPAAELRPRGRPGDPGQDRMRLVDGPDAGNAPTSAARR